MILVGVGIGYVYWQAPRFGWCGVSTGEQKRAHARKELAKAFEAKLAGRSLSWASACKLLGVVADAIEDKEPERAELLRKVREMEPITSGPAGTFSNMSLLSLAVLGAQDEAKGEAAELLEALWRVLVARTARREAVS